MLDLISGNEALREFYAIADHRKRRKSWRDDVVSPQHKLWCAPLGLGFQYAHGLGGSAWGPSQIASQLIRLDAAIGATTTAWNDQSGNGNNLSGTGHAVTINATDANFNNKPSVQTTGAGSYLASGAITQALPLSIYWVGLSSDTVSDGIITCGAATNPVLIQNATPHLVMNNGTSLDSGVAGTAAKAVVMMFHDSGDVTHSFIGVSNWLTAGVTGNANSIGGMTAFGVGAYTSGSFPAASRSAYIIVKAGLFTAGELANLAPFSGKFGITVT